jgi:hypothetical protein
VSYPFCIRLSATCRLNDGPSSISNTFFPWPFLLFLFIPFSVFSCLRLPRIFLTTDRARRMP